MRTLPSRHKQSKIPDRLLAAVPYLPSCGVVCDVGSDHGLLPLYLLRCSPELFAVVTDIRPLPLARAKAALEESGVSHRAAFVQTDGIASLGSYGIDAFVIAGMSGETIANILGKGSQILRPGQRFCLQPMSHEDILRAHLITAGFSLTEEKVVRENGKLFLWLFASFSGTPTPAADPAFPVLGDYLPKHPGQWGRAYYEALRARFARAMEKRQAAGRDATQQALILSRIDVILEEMP